MDAGGCGWSAQRLLPTGPAAVQRDYDGTPMPTDVMHDETCRELAKVLAERNEGFMQMPLVSGDNATRPAFYEEMADAQRPADAASTSCRPSTTARTSIAACSSGWSAAASAASACTARASRPTPGFTFTFEDWNLFDDSAGVVRGHHRHARGAPGQARRSGAPPGAAGQEPAGHRDRPAAATSPSSDPQLEKNRKWLDNTLGQAGEKTGKHPVDAMLDIAVDDDLETVFFAAPPNGKIEHLKEIVDDPYMLFGVSDGGAHTKFLTAGRYPTETICKVVREHRMISLEEAHWRLSALPAEVAGFRDRGVLREGAPADIVVYDFEELACCPTRSRTTCRAASGGASSAPRATGTCWSTARSRCATTSRPTLIPAGCCADGCLNHPIS